MRVILTGATGMVGQGVLRECLLAPEVEAVLSLGRRASGQQHRKLQDVVTDDLMDLAGLEEQLTGYDAGFFCLGVSSTGMSEDDYRRITYHLTMSVASTLAQINPTMTFVYVSGEGTDSTERGRSMWARVKGRTENALLGMPWQAYMFRPGYIQPMHGVTSSTNLVRWSYAVLAPLYPLLRRVAPKYVTTTETVGRAMLIVAKSTPPQRILHTRDINALAARQ